MQEGATIKLTDGQLESLRACQGLLGGGYRLDRDDLPALMKLGLIEHKLGGLKVTANGKAVLAVNKVRLR